MLNLIESRVENPMRVVDWSDVDEGQAIVCGCCGWAGRLGQCPKESDRAVCTYGCAECGMTLVARVLPRVHPFGGLRERAEWRRAHQIAANF